MKTDIHYCPGAVDGFIQRLQEEGAALRDTTNEWELVRWKWNDKTLIMYKTKHDQLSFSDRMAYQQYQAYASDVAWPHVLTARTQR